jgi:hypothetical protein
MSTCGLLRWSAASLCLVLAGCGIPRPSDSVLLLAPENLPEPVCVAPAAGQTLTGVW